MRTKTASQSDKMLDAAARLFGTQHFHEVRMEDIAAEAEVGKGTIYRYFEDKEELYLALLTRASKQLLERLEETVPDIEGSRAKLNAITEAIIVFFDEQPHLLDLIQRAEVLRGPEFPWQEARNALIRLVINAFEAAKLKGDFIVEDPELAALMLLGGIRAVLRFTDRPRTSQLAESIVANFLHGAIANEQPGLVVEPRMILRFAKDLT